MTDDAKILAEIRARCVVIYYQPYTPASLGEYPIEHNMAARKDNWDTIVASLLHDASRSILPIHTD